MVLQDISTDILLRAKKVTAVLIRKLTLPFAFSPQFCSSEPGLQSPLVADICFQIFQFEIHPSSSDDLQPINSGRICLGMRFLRPGSLYSLLRSGSPPSQGRKNFPSSTNPPAYTQLSTHTHTHTHTHTYTFIITLFPEKMANSTHILSISPASLIHKFAARMWCNRHQDKYSNITQ